MQKSELLAVPEQKAALEANITRLEGQTGEYEALFARENTALEAASANLKQKFSPASANTLLDLESRAAGAKRLLEGHQAEISRARAEREALEPALKRAEQLIWLEGLAIEGQTKLERTATLLEEITAFLQPRAEELQILANWWGSENFKMVLWAGYNSTNGVPNDNFFRIDGVLEQIRQSGNFIRPDSLKQGAAETEQWVVHIRSHLAQNLELEAVTLIENAPFTSEPRPLPPGPATPERDISAYVNKALRRTETPSGISEAAQAAAARVGRKLG